MSGEERQKDEKSSTKSKCGWVSKALVIEYMQREAANPYQAPLKRSRVGRL